VSYSLPPTQAQGSVAVAVGTASVVIMAAPGANLSYRIVGFIVAVDRLLAAGLVTVRLFVTTAGLNILPSLVLSTAGQSGLAFLFPEPGMQLAKNDSVTLSTSGSVATGNVSALVLYQLDTIT
jgi:hypothetical protein